MMEREEEPMVNWIIAYRNCIVNRQEKHTLNVLDALGVVGHQTTSVRLTDWFSSVKPITPIRFNLSNLKFPHGYFIRLDYPSVF